MGVYTKKGFEKLLGLKSGYVSTYVGRNKLVLNDDGDIDDSVELNKLFKRDRLAKKIDKETTSIKEDLSPATDQKTKSSSSEGLTTDDKDEISSISYNDRRKAELAIEKAESDSAISKLKLQQMQGKVIPTDLVVSLIKRINISIGTAFHQGSEEVATEVSQRLGGDRDDLVHIKKRLEEITNDAMEKMEDQTKSEIASIVDEYSVKRGVGESK